MLLKMYSKIVRQVFLIIISILFMAFSGSNTQRISLSMETKILKNKKVLTITADIYYQLSTGVMVTRYMKPMEYIFISNPKGEAKVYYPSTNEVLTKQSLEFDTEKTMLYYFLSGKISDLGLNNLGFTITNTKFDEGMTITSWKPPSTLISQFSKVELVHENFIPIYIAYFNPKGNLEKKIYYYEYEYFGNISLPTKVLECVFTSKTDSTLNRISYSNIKTGASAVSEYFNFKIPANAKVIK
jgi:outer membrane lipoprotein-sorting protein